MLKPLLFCPAHPHILPFEISRVKYMNLQVECQSVEEALEAAKAGADIVMLDNFTSDRIHDAASEIKKVFPHVLVEASGVS